MRISVYKVVVLGLLVVLGFEVKATTYYVSPLGDDNNSGTSRSTAWHTIQRVNQAAYEFLPGDRILFQRGGTYYGEIYPGASGTSQVPIVFSDYGVGPLPVISGGKVVSSWTQYGVNAWKATITQRVYQLYVQDQRMTVARYPNTTWLRNSCGSNSNLLSEAITQPSNYWTGAGVTLRSAAGSVDTLTVADQLGSTLSFTRPPSSDLRSDPWGFFFKGRLDLLDTVGEWFWDPTSCTIYMRSSVNPNTSSVVATVRRAGVYCGWRRHNYIIRNLHIQDTYDAGVKIEGASNITVEGCVINRCYHGISSFGSYNEIVGNYINNTYATAIAVVDHNTTITNNTLVNIASVLGEGESGEGYFGIRATGPDITIRGNRLDSIGYAGIKACDNQLIEQNTIYHSNLTLNGGAGILLSGADGLVVQDNIILNPLAGLGGVAVNTPHYQPLGAGIYFDTTLVKSAVVQRNTIANSPGVGVCTSDTTGEGCVIRDNTIFNSQTQLSPAHEQSTYGGPGPIFIPDTVSRCTTLGDSLYATAKQMLVVNEANSVRSVILRENWIDPKHPAYTKVFYLNPHCSIILTKSEEQQPAPEDVVLDSVPVNYIRVKVFLQGALDWQSKTMHTYLHIPTVHPYGDWGDVKDPEPITIPLDSIVDWVLLQVVTPTNEIIESHALLLKATGDVVNTRGSHMLSLHYPIEGNSIAIRHRNHLGVLYHGYPTNGQLVDFTLTSTPLYGTNAEASDGMYCAMWAGDVNHNGQIGYTGPSNDRDPILARLGGAVTGILVGYYDEDVNLNGTVKYTGSGNDRDIILTNVGSTTPNEIRIEQLPY